MIFENGKYRHITNKDTDGSWLFAIFIVCIIALPFWLVWKIINALFFSNKHIEKKPTSNIKSYNNYKKN